MSTAEQPAPDEMVLAMMAYVAIHRDRDQAVAVAHILARAEYWFGGRRFAILEDPAGWVLYDLDEDSDGTVESRASVVVP